MYRPLDSSRISSNRAKRPRGIKQYYELLVVCISEGGVDVLYDLLSMTTSVTMLYSDVYRNIPILADDEQSPNVHTDIEYEIPSGLDGAAFSSRMPADKLTKQEIEFFSDIAQGSNSTILDFIFVRNKILEAWLANPNEELTLEQVQKLIQMPNSSKSNLILRAHGYLQRYGYINFGVFKLLRPLQGKMPFKVLVLGAGMAGLVAARQLQFFGLDVTVLEPRSRVGGRVTTFKEGRFTADLGAMVITGLGGNPLAVVKKQLGLKMTRIKQRCPLFLTTGEMVQKDKDKTIELEFNRLLDSVSHLAHQLHVDQVHRKPLSLGKSLESVMSLQDWDQKMKVCDHLQNMVGLQEDLLSLRHRLKEMRANITATQKKEEEYKSLSRDSSGNSNLMSRARKELANLFERYDELLESQMRLENKLEDMEDISLPEIYMSPLDHHIMSWHFANLEFANAAPLTALSLKHWDQDDEFEFTGHHLAMRSGYSEVPESLAKGVDIRFRIAGQSIRYSNEGVEVHAVSTDTGSSQIYRADAVLCTVPLGVLKSGALTFHPPLPEWKQQAINNMGFGLLNKVILCFHEQFWDHSLHMFGHVGTSWTTRGEFFLFWHLSETPVLIALVAGEDALKFESLSDQVIVAKAMAVLRSIFGDTAVPEPQCTKVTRWLGDEWARGSYSYVAVGSSGNDYDFMAEAVSPQRNKPFIPQPKLFFAGEHTIRNYPATVHGAMLSGLREAGKIADMLLGTPYTPSPNTTNIEVAQPPTTLADIVHNS